MTRDWLSIAGVVVGVVAAVAILALFVIHGGQP